MLLIAEVISWLLVRYLPNHTLKASQVEWPQINALLSRLYLTAFSITIVHSFYFALASANSDRP